MKISDLPGFGSRAARVLDYLLPRILKLEGTFPRLVVYQAAGDGVVVTTTGQDTFVGNKVELPLTEYKSEGGLEVDVANKYIINNSLNTLDLLFDAVSTVSDPSANNTRINFVLFKNGTEIQTQTQSFIKLETQTGAGTLNAASEVQLAPGDYLEIYCMTDKLDASFSVDHVQLRLVGRS